MHHQFIKCPYINEDGILTEGNDIVKCLKSVQEWTLSQRRDIHLMKIPCVSTYIFRQKFYFTLTVEFHPLLRSSVRNGKNIRKKFYLWHIVLFDTDGLILRYLRGIWPP